MTTPIEAGAKAMSEAWNRMHTNEGLGKQKMLTKAAFGSIDREGLKDVLNDALGWNRNDADLPDVVDAILAWLNGAES